MAERKREREYVKAVYPRRPDWEFYLPREDKKLIERLSMKPILPETCDRPCTKVMTLFP